MSVEQKKTLLRWMRFNTVGVAGTCVQLVALWLLTQVLRIDYLPATAVAVEIALVHNFVWHETWTWRGGSVEHRWRRLLRFHLTIGLVSIASNTVLTWAFTQHAGFPLLAANLASVVVTSLLNFLLVNAVVFEARITRPDLPAPAAGSASPCLPES